MPSAGEFHHRKWLKYASAQSRDLGLDSGCYRIFLILEIHNIEHTGTFCPERFQFNLKINIHEIHLYSFFCTLFGSRLFVLDLYIFVNY